jgi:hypothetical protein
VDFGFNTVGAAVEDIVAAIRELHQTLKKV